MDDIRSAHIVLRLTNRCPNLCRHCYNNAGCASDVFELSFSDIKNLYRILKNRYEKVVLTLSGGDPTMREDLADIIKLFGNDPKFKLVIFSQSSRLIEYRYLLERYNIKGNITVNGLPETHDMIMGRKHAWRDAEKLIRTFHWPVRIFVYKENLREAAEIARLLVCRGYESAELARPVRCGRGSDIDLPSNEECLQFINIMNENGITVCGDIKNTEALFKEKLNFWQALLLKIFPRKILKDYNINVRKIMKKRLIGYCFFQYANDFVDILDISEKGDVTSSCCFGINNPFFYAGNILNDDWEKIRSCKPHFDHELIRKRFGNTEIVHTMDACDLCLQCQKDL